MYCFKTPDIKFELIFEHYYMEEDRFLGNPYNTFIRVNVAAYGYSGKSEWIVDFSEFRIFASELNEMYKNLSGKTQLKDKEYGSVLNVECNNTGYFLFSGKLIADDTFQKLEFNFQIDQTYIGKFIDDLYNDYGKSLGD